MSAILQDHFEYVEFMVGKKALEELEVLVVALIVLLLLEIIFG